MCFAIRLMTVVVSLSMSISSTCHAEQGAIWKIEEDWTMVIVEPDPANNSPQISFSTFPTVHTEDVYFQLQMNYAADISYSAGGFKVAAIQNESAIDESRSESRSALSVDGDRISWTSVMAVIDGKLLFAIKDGFGDHWGKFGGPEYLVRVADSPVQNLAKYHPRKSLESVDIGFGANRVESTTLVQVRVYYADGSMVVVPVNRSPSL